MRKKKEHGERNKTLSSELYADGKGVYLDWSVTTAFYSSIHLVDHKIFPCKINGQHCKNIEDVKNAYGVRGRHLAREKMVREKLTNLSVKFKWLDDKSRYARYISFKVTSGVAEKSQQYLKAISEHCVS